MSASPWTLSPACPAPGRLLIRLCDLVRASSGRNGLICRLPGRGGCLGGPPIKWGGPWRPAGHTEACSGGARVHFPWPAAAYVRFQSRRPYFLATTSNLIADSLIYSLQPWPVVTCVLKANGGGKPRGGGQWGLAQGAWRSFLARQPKNPTTHFHRPPLFLGRWSAKARNHPVPSHRFLTSCAIRGRHKRTVGPFLTQ
jgi:hypothetical protein